MQRRWLVPWLAFGWLIILAPQVVWAQEEPSGGSPWDLVRKKLPSTGPLTGFQDVVSPEVMGSLSFRAGARISGFRYQIDEFPAGPGTGTDVQTVRYDLFAGVALLDAIELGLQVPIEDVDVDVDVGAGDANVREVDFGDVQIGIKGAYRIEFLRIGVFSIIELPTADQSLSEIDPRFLRTAGVTNNMDSWVGATASVVFGPFEALANVVWWTGDSVTTSDFRNAFVYRLGFTVTPIPFLRAGIFWQGTEPEGSIDQNGEVQAGVQLYVPPVFVDLGGTVTVLTDGWEDITGVDDVDVFGANLAFGIVF